SPRCPIIGRENAAHVFSDTSTGPGMISLSFECMRDAQRSALKIQRVSVRLSPWKGRGEINGQWESSGDDDTTLIETELRCTRHPCVASLFFVSLSQEQ